MTRINTGQNGEAIARKYLENNGYRILAANWRSKNAEIDLIAKKAKEIVFVEVRSKSTEDFGTPAESVTLHKQRKLINAAQCYIVENQIDAEWRIDFIGIQFIEETHRLEHIPYAVTLD
ncbi:MAG: YraN family protein [Dehalogenimonas sp.]